MPALWYPGIESERTPHFRCELCGSQFDRNETFRRHVMRCVRTNDPQPPEETAYTHFQDKELVAYVKKANREGVKLRGIVGSKGTPKHRPKKLPPKVQED